MVSYFCSERIIWLDTKSEYFFGYLGKFYLSQHSLIQSGPEETRWNFRDMMMTKEIL